MRFFLKGISLLLLPLFILFSCATLPEKSLVPEAPDLLPREQDLYLSLGIQGNRSLAESLFLPLLSGTPFGNSFLDKTERVYLSYSENPPGFSSFSLAALGAYPRVSINIALRNNREWENPSGNPKVFRHREEGLEVSVPEQGLLLVSNGSMPEMITKYLKGTEAGFSPETLILLETADMAVVATRLPESFASLLKVDPGRIKTKQITASFVRVAEGNYQLVVEFQMDTEREAKALNALLRFAVLADRRKEEGSRDSLSLARAEVNQVGSSVVVQGLSLQEEVLQGILASPMTPAPRTSKDSESQGEN